MRVFIYLIVLVSVLTCNSNKEVTKNLTANKTASKKSCPDDGICTFNILKNKNFKIKKDEFGLSYSELLEGNKTILKFEYKRNNPDNLQDANYSEIIYIEIENNTESLNLKDLALSKVNAGFSRLCFCRGQTGSYPINIGDLNIIKVEENTYTLNFDFKVTEVPQVITSINETFKL